MFSWIKRIINWLSNSESGNQRQERMVYAVLTAETAAPVYSGRIVIIGVVQCQSISLYRYRFRDPLVHSPQFVECASETEK
jgi:hypothetical protein